MSLLPLSLTHPELCLQADGWDLDLYTSGSNVRKPWKCDVGHLWEASIYDRTRGRGCPFCSGAKVLIGFNDLGTTQPEIAEEAFGWDPTTLSSGSGKRRTWRCSKGHHWEAKVVDRTSGTGCPFCAGKTTLVGFNDLATTHPHLAIEACGWDPTTFTAGSNMKLWWKCAIGHRFESRVVKRSSRNDGCPICSNFKVLIGFNDMATTHPEIASQAEGWDPTAVIAGSGKKFKWRCDKGHTWIAMAVDRKYGHGCPTCKNLKLLIGFNDLATTHPDLAKEANGWDPKLIVAGTNKRLKWICAVDHEWEAMASSRSGQNQGCPYCASRKILMGFNDLKTTHPELALQAVDWDPKRVMAGNKVKRRWRCELGHEWEAQPNNRSGRQDGCPICSNQKLLTGFNDLKTTHPELALQAVGWDPSLVIAGSHKKRKWRCELGHEWEAQPNDRSGQKSGCPSCAPSGFDPNEKGWLYLLNHTEWEMLQIGITNYPENRLRSHGKLGWQVIEIRGPMSGELTRAWEKSILAMLKFRGATLAPVEIAGRFDGYTECWIRSSLPVTSLRELMTMVAEDEENGAGKGD